MLPKENARQYLTKYLFHINYKMDAYESDLKKYWYVRTSTLNKVSCSNKKKEKRNLFQEESLKRKKSIKNRLMTVRANKYRSWRCIKRIFEQHYWKIDYCMICWCKDKLQIHHKDKNRRNNKYSNLIKVCIGCHIKAHEWEKAWRFMKNVYKI